MSGDREDGRVVLTQLHSSSSQPSSFGNLRLSVDNPPIHLALTETHCGSGIRRSVVRIAFDSFVKQAERFVGSIPGPFVEMCLSAQKEVVGIEAVGWFDPGTFDFCKL